MTPAPQGAAVASSPGSKAPSSGSDAPGFGGLSAASPRYSGGRVGAPYLLVGLVLVGISWLACWFVAASVARNKFASASFAMRAIEARTRRMRVRNIVLAAPITATVFNLMLMSILSRPVFDADASGNLGADRFLLYPGSPSLDAGYLDFCAIASLVSLVAGFAYVTLAPEAFGPREMGSAVSVSFAAWSLCGVTAAAAVLRAEGAPAWLVLMVAALFVVAAALSGGGLFAMNNVRDKKKDAAASAASAADNDAVAKQGGGSADKPAPASRNVSYALVLIGTLLFAGHAVHGGAVEGTGLGTAAIAVLVCGAVSLVANIASDKEFLSETRKRKAGDAAALAVLIATLVMSWAAFRATFFGRTLFTLKKGTP